MLLSPTHRLRALLLLGRFVTLGAWAVSEMLSVGIFPYILKLLLSAASELRPPLLFIWARVLLHDSSCQADLQRDAAHAFFIDILRPSATAETTRSGQTPSYGWVEGMGAPTPPVPHCLLALFVLAAVCRQQPEGRAACLRQNLPELLAQQLDLALDGDCDGGGGGGGGGGGDGGDGGGDGGGDERREAAAEVAARCGLDSTVGSLRSQWIVWICLCTSQLCEEDQAAQDAVHACRLDQRLLRVLQEAEPEARAAALYALTAVCSSMASSGAPSAPTTTPTTTPASGAPSAPTTTPAEAACPVPVGAVVGSSVASPPSAAEDWRLELGAEAVLTIADGSPIVRAQLCRLLLTLTRRHPGRCAEGCHQLLWLRAQSMSTLGSVHGGGGLSSGGMLPFPSSALGAGVYTTGGGGELAGGSAAPQLAGRPPLPGASDLSQGYTRHLLSQGYMQEAPGAGGAGAGAGAGSRNSSNSSLDACGSPGGVSMGGAAVGTGGGESVGSTGAESVEGIESRVSLTSLTGLPRGMSTSAGMGASSRELDTTTVVSGLTPTLGLGEAFASHAIMMKHAMVLEPRMIGHSLATAAELSATLFAAAMRVTASAASMATPTATPKLSAAHGGQEQPPLRARAVLSAVHVGSAPRPAVKAPPSPLRGQSLSPLRGPSIVNEALQIAERVTAAARDVAAAESDAADAAAAMLAVEGGAVAAATIKLCAALILIARDSEPRIATRAQQQLRALVPLASLSSPMHPTATPLLPRAAPTPEMSRRAGASGGGAGCVPTSGSEDSGAERSGAFFGARLQRPMALALGSAAGGAGSAGAENLDKKSHPGIPPYTGAIHTGAIHTGAMAMPRGALPARSLTTTPFRDGTPPVALTPEPPMGGMADGADAFAQLMPRAELSAELPPPLELGGDMYEWATQQLHRGFPTINDRGEIQPPRGQERRAHPFLAVAAALVDPAVAAAAAAVADAANGGAGAISSANGGAGTGGAGVSTPSTLERPARPTKSYTMAFGGLRIGGGDDRERQQAASLKCEDQLATLDSGSMRCSSLALHASEPLLVAASAREEVSVWNYKTKQRINAFANANPAGSRCTSMHLLETAGSLVNGHASLGLLLVGSSEGAVRIWRQWALPGEQQMVGSFLAADRSAAATEAASLHDSRLFTAYQPQGALLSVAASTSNVIRQWDLVAERCARQLTVDVADAFSVRALASDMHSSLLVVGGTDGATRIIDPRLPSADCTVATVGAFASRAHIAQLTLQTSDRPWVAIATHLGDMGVWDLRRAVSSASALPHSSSSAAPLVHTITSHKSGLSALSLHDHLPLLASGSRNQFIKLFDLTALRDNAGPARELSTIRYFDGFLGARIGPVTCLAFHPTKPLLAVGATDSVVSIYSS